MCRSFLSMDSYGSSVAPAFNFQGEKSKQTYLGACLRFLVLCFVLMFTIITLVNVFDTSQYTITPHLGVNVNDAWMKEVSAY